MSLCHRFGSRVCNYLRALFPHFLANFRAAKDAPDTRLLHVWYAPHWWPFGPSHHHHAQPVAWEARLFRAMGAKALQQLIRLERDFDANGGGC